MEVAKLAAPPNLEVRFVSCNESAIKRWLSSELEETVFSLTHELFMSKHHTVTLTLKNYFGICITTTIFMGINICRAIRQEGSVELPFFLVLL